MLVRRNPVEIGRRARVRTETEKPLHFLIVVGRVEVEVKPMPIVRFERRPQATDSQAEK